MVKVVLVEMNINDCNAVAGQVFGQKMVKSPYNCVIFLLTQPQVANQQQQITLSIYGFLSCMLL